MGFIQQLEKINEVEQQSRITIENARKKADAILASSEENFQAWKNTREEQHVREIADLEAKYLAENQSIVAKIGEQAEQRILSANERARINMEGAVQAIIENVLAGIEGQ